MGMVSLYKNGELIDRGPNRIMTEGKKLFAELIALPAGSRTPPYVDRISHFLLGNGAQATDPAQTNLQGDRLYPGPPGGTREAIFSINAGFNIVNVVGAVTNNDAETWEVAEIGLFNALAGGIMIARFLPSQVGKFGVGETLNFVWQQDIGGLL